MLKLQFVVVVVLVVVGFPHGFGTAGLFALRSI